MYNIETHQKYRYLEKFIKSSNGPTFKDFLNEINTAAHEISTHMKDYNYYGYNRFTDQFFDKKTKTVNEKLLAETITNKIVGDMLEIFCAYYLQYFESDICYGIERGSYKFNNDENDIGCDGVGTIRTNNNLAFIQIKYRSNPLDRPFVKDVFCGLFTDATLNFGLDYNNPNQRLIFFTNLSVGKVGSWNARTGVFNICAKTCKVPVVLIGFNEISNYVDGNTGFWNGFIS